MYFSENGVCDGQISLFYHMFVFEKQIEHVGLRSVYSVFSSHHSKGLEVVTSDLWEGLWLCVIPVRSAVCVGGCTDTIGPPAPQVLSLQWADLHNLISITVRLDWNLIKNMCGRYNPPPAARDRVPDNPPLARLLTDSHTQWTMTEACKAF